MDIIAHRGFWLDPAEKNSFTAFERALSNGYGIETDVRDESGELVIAHDIPSGGEETFREFLELYNRIGNKTQLAINIKADSLAGRVAELLVEYNVEDYFVFDMSVPDMRAYLQKNMHTYARLSEYESDSTLHESCIGMWLDEFEGHWITNELITGLIKNGKTACIVSPELHGRQYQSVWQQYRGLPESVAGGVSICTDFPDKAKEYFHGN